MTLEDRVRANNAQNRQSIGTAHPLGSVANSKESIEPLSIRETNQTYIHP